MLADKYALSMMKSGRGVYRKANSSQGFVERAAERYDVIMEAYDHENYLDREVNDSPSFFVNGIMNSNSTEPLIVLGVALFVGACAFGLFTLKRLKEK